MNFCPLPFDEFYIDDIKSAVVLVPRGAYQANAPSVKAARKFNAAIAECYWDDVKNEVALDVKDLGQLKGKSNAGILKAQSDDVALVLHTSGTTGFPKPVTVRAGMLAVNDAIRPIPKR